MIHRIENQGIKALVFIEVQRGDYLGEDDIERLEDDFGRTRNSRALPADRFADLCLTDPRPLR